MFTNEEAKQGEKVPEIIIQSENYEGKTLVVYQDGITLHSKGQDPVNVELKGLTQANTFFVDLNFLYSFKNG